MTEMILGWIGGLGLFLYGMKLMRESLEMTAGVKMRGVLEFFTKTPLRGIFVGAFFTAIIQSSSAATVTVVSLVNSGLLNLFQAAGVILGANIGTTITTQIFSLKISALAPILVIVGILLLMFIKKTKVQRAGEILLGFGILFFGLTVMSDSMSILKEVPQIADLLGTLTNPFLAFAAGIVVTTLLQSSTAALGILIVFAQQDLIDIQVCYFIILGCHIGSCVPALLASINGKKEAVRAALTQLFFNLIGTIVMCIVIAVAIEPITVFLNYISNGQSGRMIANAHTIVRLLEVILLAPFMKSVVKLTGYFVTEEVEEEKGYELHYIGEKSVFSPTTAVFDATKELEHMGQLAVENLEKSMNAFITLEFDEIKEVYQNENYIDFLNHSITDYLVEINQISLPGDDEKVIGSLFHVVNDIERIGDHAVNIADAALSRLEKNIEFSVHAQKELSELLELVVKITRYSLDMFSHDNQEHGQEIMELENKVDAMEKQLHDAHVERLTRNECTASAGMMFSDVISGLERVSDHAVNIAFSMMDEDPTDQEKDFRDYL